MTLICLVRVGRLVCLKGLDLEVGRGKIFINLFGEWGSQYDSDKSGT